MAGRLGFYGIHELLLNGRGGEMKRILVSILIALYCPLLLAAPDKTNWKHVNAFTYGDIFYTPNQFHNDLSLYAFGGDEEQFVSFSITTNGGRGTVTPSVGLRSALTRAMDSWRSAINRYNANRVGEARVALTLRISSSITGSDGIVALALNDRQEYIMASVGLEPTDTLAVTVPVVSVNVFTDLPTFPEFPATGIIVRRNIVFDLNEANRVAGVFGFSRTDIPNMTAGDWQYIADTYIQTLLMHEIGHFIGLAHPEDATPPRDASTPPSGNNQRNGLRQNVDTVINVASSAPPSSLSPPLMGGNINNYFSDLSWGRSSQGLDRGIRQEDIVPSDLELSAIVNLDSCGQVLEDDPGGSGGRTQALASSGTCVTSTRSARSVSSIIIMRGR